MCSLNGAAFDLQNKTIAVVVALVVDSRQREEMLRANPVTPVKQVAVMCSSTLEVLSDI